MGFLFNAISLGVGFGAATGLLEAVYLIATKQSLFVTGVRKVELLFEGIVINGIAGLIIGAGLGACLLAVFPVLARSMRCAILSSLLVSTLVSVIVSIKSGASVPLADGRSIVILAVTGLLCFGGLRFFWTRNPRWVDAFDAFIRRRLLLYVAGAAVLSLGAQVVERAVWNRATPQATETRPNILVVMIDAARADRFSSYGYERRTTPLLDAFAETGTRFENAYANSNWSGPSTAALFTGKLPSQIGFGTKYRYVDDRHVTIAELLTRNGYNTVAFSNNPWISSKTNLDRGFENFLYMGERFEGVQYFSFYRVLMLSEAVVDRLRGGDNKGTRKTIALAQKWLRTYGKGRPFFAFIHTLDPHNFYLPPTPYDRLFLDPSVDYESVDQERLLMSTADVPDDDLERELAIIKSLYDGEIAYADSQVSKLFTTLDRVGIRDNTMVVILADHGEYLYEKKMFRHGTGLYEPVLRIPLIVRYPVPLQEHQPAVREHPVSLVDLFPTIAEVVGIELDQEALELPGRSLLDPLTGHVVIAETDDNVAKAIFKDGLKLIVNRNQPDELYDFRADRTEERNLLPDLQAEADVLRRELDQVLARFTLVGLDRERGDQFSTAQLQELRALGYLR